MIAQQVIAVACAQCGRKYQWKDQLAGRKVLCKCGGEFIMPRQAPPAQSCASTAVDEPAATSTATAVDAVNDPRLQKEDILQSLKSDFTEEMQAAGKGLKATITSADAVDAQHYCPQCRAIMLAGATECNRCGYTVLKPHIYNPLRDRFVAPLIWGGVVALILSIAFSWISYFVALLTQSQFGHKYELGFLGAALAIFTVSTMRRKDSPWSKWHTVGAWTYVVGAYLIFRTTECAWLEINFFSLLDLLYIPLTGLVAYNTIRKASRKRLVL